MGDCEVEMVVVWGSGGQPLRQCGQGGVGTADGRERVIEEQCWPAEGWWWRGQVVVGVCGQGVVVAV